MPSFSARSNARLNTCDQGLQALFRAVVKDIDCTVLEGHRGEQAQNEYFKSGASKVQWPDGKHNTYPSRAVDVSPYPIPENWGDHPDPKVISRFYYFAGYVLATAKALDIKIRWGGDWDGDHQFRDQTFDDLVHFEEAEDGR